MTPQNRYVVTTLGLGVVLVWSVLELDARDLVMAGIAVAALMGVVAIYRRRKSG